MQFNQSVKKVRLFLLILLGVSVQSVFAQAPQGLNYQAIARDASGALIPNQLIGLRFTITNGDGGPILYREVQSTTTNQFGLFTINLGNGTPDTTLAFSSINWGSVSAWLKVEMDPADGGNFTTMGTSQLLSVPYALFAASGTPGPAGTTWYTGSGAPPGGLGAINDLYLDTVTGNYYKKTGASTWTLQGTFSGGANINGTANYVIKFTGATSGGNSLIYDNGTNVGIGTTTPTFLFDVIGSAATSVGASSNTNSTGTGFAAANTAAVGTDVGNGLYGSTQQSGGVGVYAANFSTTGTGILGVGNDVTYTLPTEGAGGAFYGSTFGVYGFSAGTSSYGVFGKATDPSSAYGVVGAANDVVGAAPSSGAGGAFFAYDYGVSAVITDQNYEGGTQMAGGYFGLGYDGTSDASTTLVEAVAVSGTHYKIWGSPAGTVSTTVPDLNGKQVTLHAPETPEFYFQDYGQGALINGKAHIDIDPILAANVKISDKHPLRVFVQLEGDCKGVYVTNKTATGFDVVELGGGTSNVSFQWSITCNVADAKLGKGISPFADLRFEAGPNQDLKKLSQKEQTKNTK